VGSASFKTALVTGSGKKRIGAVVAEVLARAGWNVVLHYRSSAEEAHARAAQLTAFGIKCQAFGADLTNEQEVERLVSEVWKQFGKLDLLVTAQGVWPKIKLEDVHAQDVVDQFAANTLATFLCCKAAGLKMAADPEGGVIVTIGDWALQRPYPDYSAYFVSKGAIPVMTRSLAVELARRNPRVRVNCVMPGPVMLPEDLPQAEKQEALRGTLLGRFGAPHHVAQAVLYLVENDYVTGECLTVDGGRSLG